MKKSFKIILVVFCMLFFFTSNSFAQNDDSSVWVVTKLQLAFPDGGTIAEYDSLNQLYTDKVIKKNEYILSSYNLRHLWGNNSSDYLIVYEVASFENVAKANARNTELFREAWSTSEARKAYNDAANKYFTPIHADEIYTEIKSGRK